MAAPSPAFRLKPGAVAVVAMIAGLALASGPAPAQTPAQTPPPAAEPSQEITVIAPRVVVRPRPADATPLSRIPIEVISLTRYVSYTDLDLTKPDDADAFAARVRDTAKAACDELEAKYPSALYPPAPAEQNCVKTTTDETMAMANRIIAAAVMQVR